MVLTLTYRQETLVIGMALDPHNFRAMPTNVDSPGTRADHFVELTGLTCPWNTFAIWDLAKLAKVHLRHARTMLFGSIWPCRLGSWLFQIRMSNSANLQLKKCPPSLCTSTFSLSTLRRFLSRSRIPACTLQVGTQLGMHTAHWPSHLRISIFFQ
jgi:hypothetical protein